MSWVPITHAVQYTLFIYKFGLNNTMTYNTTTTNTTVSDLDAGSLYSIKGLAWDIEGIEGESSLISNQTTSTSALSNLFVCVYDLVSSVSVCQITHNKGKDTQ